MKVIILILTLFLSACTSVTEEQLNSCRTDLKKQKKDYEQQINRLKYRYYSETEAGAMFEYCRSFNNQRFAFLCDAELGLIGKRQWDEGNHRTSQMKKALLYLGTVFLIAFPFILSGALIRMLVKRFYGFLSVSSTEKKLRKHAEKHQKVIDDATNIEKNFDSRKLELEIEIQNLEIQLDELMNDIKSKQIYLEENEKYVIQLEEEIIALERKQMALEKVSKLNF